MIDRFYTRELEIVQPVSAGADRYGSQGVTWPAAGRVAYGWVSQTDQTEPQALGRDPLVTSLVLFLPPETAITGRSRVILDGVTYTVEGSPHVAHQPSGPHHLEVRLQEVAG